MFWYEPIICKERSFRSFPFHTPKDHEKIDNNLVLPQSGSTVSGKIQNRIAGEAMLRRLGYDGQMKDLK